MDVISLYTNIPQNKGIGIVCKAYENFYKDNPPIPIYYLREMLRLILKLMLLTHNPLDKQVTRPELLWEKG